VNLAAHEPDAIFAVVVDLVPAHERAVRRSDGQAAFLVPIGGHIVVDTVVKNLDTGHGILTCPAEVHPVAHGVDDLETLHAHVASVSQVHVVVPHILPVDHDGISGAGLEGDHRGGGSRVSGLQ